MAPKQAALPFWRCPFTPCTEKGGTRREHRTLYSDRYLKFHTDRNNPALTIDQHRALSRELSEKMERAQRNRVPTAKAAENSAATTHKSSAVIDPAKLPITTPEWKLDDPEDSWYEEQREVTKVDPVKKVSSTTGQEIQLFRLGPHLECRDKYHYARARCEQDTVYFHNAYVEPDYARFSDENHTLCMGNIDPRLDVRFTKDMLTAYGSGPARTFKANVCAREGTFFYETKIVSCYESNMDVQVRKGLQFAVGEGRFLKNTRMGTPRIGFARREAWNGVDVGASAYGYGITTTNMGSQHPNYVTCGGNTRPLPNMPIINEGDVIGLMITLPSIEDHKRVVTAKTPEDLLTKKSTDSHAGSVEPEPAAQATAVQGSKVVPAKKSKKARSKKEKGKGKAVDNDPTTSGIAFEIPQEQYATIKDYDPSKPIDDPPHQIIHERYPVRAKGHVYFESSEYLVRTEMKPGASLSIRDEKDVKRAAMGRPIPRQPIKWFDTPAFHDWPNMRSLPSSKIEMWVNGKYCGVVVENLFAFLPPASVVDVQQKEKQLPPNMLSGEWDDGTLGYYPAVSLFAGAMVEWRFHDFWYGHDGRPGVRTFEDRYVEQKIDDMVYDAIDECGWAADHVAVGDIPLKKVFPVTKKVIRESQAFMKEWHAFIEKTKHSTGHD